MKEIKIDCFAQNETCRIISDFKNISIFSPLENDYSLQITNQSENDCAIDFQLKRIEQSDNLSKVNLLITKEKELLFQDTLEVFLEQKISLNSIKGNTSNKYFLTFDFINLSVENKKITLNFDFLLNFHCVDQIEEELSVTNLVDSQTMAKENKSEVLAASDGKNNLVIEKNSNFFSSPIFYLLSSLFIVVFFVIIKFVNGKKNKNKE